LRLIAELGVDICIVAHFTPAFSRTRAEDFVKGVLVEKIGAHEIYVGENFRFGRGASGDYRLLEKLSRLYHFGLKAFDIIRINRTPVSSTRIRRLINQGRLGAAERMLSKPVSVLGTVVKGDSVATSLGFPTANIRAHHEILPPAGIYVVRVIIARKKFKGVCYIGGRPTINRGAKSNRHKNIEVHIFNFRKNIYGMEVEIQFLKKLRKEKKFATPQDLARQVRIDISKAKHKFFLPPAHPNS
jgi:riboflavin kinase/FMN adenylyltransferase